MASFPNLNELIIKCTNNFSDTEDECIDFDEIGNKNILLIKEILLNVKLKKLKLINYSDYGNKDILQLFLIPFMFSVFAAITTNFTLHKGGHFKNNNLDSPVFIITMIFYMVALQTLGIPKPKALKFIKEFSKILQHTDLQILDLNNNSLTDADAFILADALKKHPSIKILKLKHNLITAHGAKALNDPCMLNLKAVDLRSNVIDGFHSAGIKDILTPVPLRKENTATLNAFMSHLSTEQKVLRGKLLKELNENTVGIIESYVGDQKTLILNKPKKTKITLT